MNCKDWLHLMRIVAKFVQQQQALPSSLSGTSGDPDVRYVLCVYYRYDKCIPLRDCMSKFHFPSLWDLHVFSFREGEKEQFTLFLVFLCV